MQEETLPQEEVLLPPLEDNAPKTEEIDLVFILPSLREALLTYLKTRPYDEVENLIPPLTLAHKQKVMVNVQS